MLLLGIVFTGISTLVYAVLLRHVTAQAAGILTFLEPVAAVFLAWVLLDESLAPQAIVGGALVLLAGIAVVALEPAESACERGGCRGRIAGAVRAPSIPTCPTGTSRSSWCG